MLCDQRLILSSMKGLVFGGVLPDLYQACWNLFSILTESRSCYYCLTYPTVLLQYLRFVLLKLERKELQRFVKVYTLG